MTVNLKNFTKTMENVTQTKNYQLKHKITVNNPKQTHFSVQGVQTYNPNEIKALKIRQDAQYQNKQGEFIKLKVVLLSDQIIEQDTVNNKDQLQWKMEKPKTAKSVNRSSFKTNARNSMSKDMQSAVKLEKQLVKKTQMQKQLEQLQKKYKKHFQGVEMKAPDIKQEENKQVEEPNINDKNQEGNKSQPTQMRSNKEERFSKSKTRKTKAQTSKYAQQNIDFEDIPFDGQKNIFKAILQKSSYSQRLGTAVNSLFN